MSENATEPQDDARPPADRQDEDMAHVKRAVAVLMEHFESVQVFVTRHVSTDEGTTNVAYGEGNWFARFGQVVNWLDETRHPTET